MSGLLAAERALTEVHDLALLDLDGVVYVGPDAVPAAPAALAAAREAGMQLSFVTNNAARPPQEVAEHLTRIGVPAAESEVVTSAMAAAAILAARLPAGSPVLVVGGAGLRWALKREGLRPVDSVAEAPKAVVQGFSPDLGWRLLAEGARAVRAGLPWVATNTDLTVPMPWGPAPGNGTLVAAVRTATGVEPEVAGKPEPPLFVDAARRAGGAAPLVVGDRLDTDLEGARAAGIPGLLVFTGVCGVDDLLAAPPHQRPSYLGRDLWALLEPHPAPAASGAGSWRCGDAEVALVAGELKVVEPGGDPLNLVRAACPAAWQALDARAAAAAGGGAERRQAGGGAARRQAGGDAPRGAGQAGHDSVLSALRRLDPAGSWG